MFARLYRKKIFVTSKVSKFGKPEENVARKVAEMSRISYSMQILTAGEQGSSLSLCLCVEKLHLYSQERKILARYLFNVGDNLPRVAQENKVCVMCIYNALFVACLIGMCIAFCLLCMVHCA